MPTPPKLPIKLVSADSHVIEPPNLWAERLAGTEFAEIAPRVISAGEGHAFWAPGIAELPIAGFGSAGMSVDEVEALGAAANSDLPRGGWDPKARLLDQEKDGVEAEVLYASLAMRLFALPNHSLRTACFRAYNEWLAEYVQAAPGHFLGQALIALDDPFVAVKELEHARDLGLVGAMIPVQMEQESFSSRRFDRVWRAAEALHMPLTLHVLTGETEIEIAPSGEIDRYMQLHHCVQRSLVQVLTGGMLERHPSLMLVSAENDAGWVPHFLARLDKAFGRLRRADQLSQSMSPQELFDRQIWLTFQDDPTVVGQLGAMNEDHLCWGSDYPHGDSTFPHSLETIRELFEGVSAETVHKITRANALSLYVDGP